ncbi:hypothetical protein ACJX0J_028848 [Zea mays]
MSLNSGLFTLYIINIIDQYYLGPEISENPMGNHINPEKETNETPGSEVNQELLPATLMKPRVCSIIFGEGFAECLRIIRLEAILHKETGAFALEDLMIERGLDPIILGQVENISLFIMFLNLFGFLFDSIILLSFWFKCLIHHELKIWV